VALRLVGTHVIGLKGNWPGSRRKAVLRLVGSGPKIGGNLEVYMFRAKGEEGGRGREGKKGGC
jgi:hypothetical protein